MAKSWTGATHSEYDWRLGRRLLNENLQDSRAACGSRFS